MDLNVTHFPPPLPKKGDPVTYGGKTVGVVTDVTSDSILLTIDEPYADKIAEAILSVGGIATYFAKPKDQST